MNDRPHNADPKGLGLIFRALYHRNYRLFFGGQGISLIGTWMQQIAMSWLVYRMTGSAFLLGVVGFVGQISSFLLGPFTGVLTDRWNRHHILLMTQALSMVQALLLAFLDLTGLITVHHIMLLSAFLGMINSFDMPARQAFVIDMLEKKEDLGNAIALNSFLFNGARLVGPSVGGILISILGEGLCFLLNGISFFAVIMALLAMKIKPGEKEIRYSHVMKGLEEGFRYGLGFAPIRLILFFVGWVSLVGTAYTTLMPIFAKNILRGGPSTLGFLMAASGVGALVGALYLAWRQSVLGLGRWIAIAATIFGMGLIAFSLSHALLLSLSLLVFVGFGWMIQMASSNTVLQTMVDDDKRGRVMSLYMMAFMGMAPFGSLLGGSLASKIGTPETLIIGGLSCILGSFLFIRKLPLLREMARPIYIRKGILPKEPGMRLPES